MRFAFRLSALALVLAVPAGAQVYSDGIVVEALPLGARNVSTNLHAEGTRLYAGPRLAIRDGSTPFRFVDDPAFTPPAAPTASIYSIDVEGDVIWVGLGFNDANADGTPQTAAGFAYSTDGGATWAFRPPPLDSPDDDTEGYGGSTLPALPVIVPQQSPPFDIDYDPVSGLVWTSGWASGLRVSANDGAAWERVVLPPDTLAAVSPDSVYCAAAQDPCFTYAPERNPGEEANNFLSFSVLVDEAGTVWAGSVAGVNRSDSSDVGPTPGDRRWRRFFFDGTPRSLVGNWTISIEEQPRAGRNPVWMANWRAVDLAEEFGLTVWTGDDEDGDPIFEPRLIGEKVYDTAFDPADSLRVYAAGDAGLFISDDDGGTWRTVRVFRDAAGADLPVRLDATAYAVAVTADGALWVGTDDGLLTSTDRGTTWQQFRVNVAPGEGDGAPDATSYAYPNPFAPSTDGTVRIRYELPSDAAVRVRIFDFASTLVRELDGGSGRAGANETRWDGRAEDGTRIANGVYFYVVEAGSERFTGRILVLE